MNVIIAVGGCAVMAAGVLLRLGDKRGIVCWTLSSLTLALAGGQYLGSHTGFIPNYSMILPAALAIGAVLAITFAVELLAPSKRLRAAKTEYDSRRAEDALNLVLAIITAVLAIAAGLSGNYIPESLGVLLIIPALGISIRQVSYCLYRIKSDSLAPKTDEQLRLEITKKLGSKTSRL